MIKISRFGVLWGLVLLVAVVAWAAGGLGVRAAAAGVEDEAQEYIERAGVEQGIGVLLARQPAELAVAMARQSQWILYVQRPDEAEVESVRRSVDAAGMLGTRIYVEQGDGAHIHLATHLADAVVVPDPAGITESEEQETLRVVRPLGKVLLGDRQRINPYPTDADDWTHPYHGPDNNPLSHDQLARAPYWTQFLAEPWYVPFPEVTVTSAGRVFKAFGHVGYKERNWPWPNTLVAINGYNGTLLWRRPLEPGFNIHRNTMVASPDTLYLADSRSCKLLDTATGEVKGQIVAPAGSTGRVWKWMAVEDGVLYALVGEEELRDETVRGTRIAAGWPWPATPSSPPAPPADRRGEKGNTSLPHDRSRTASRCGPSPCRPCPPDGAWPWIIPGASS